MIFGEYYSIWLIAVNTLRIPCPSILICPSVTKYYKLLSAVNKIKTLRVRGQGLRSDKSFQKNKTENPLVADMEIALFLLLISIVWVPNPNFAAHGDGGRC